MYFEKPSVAIMINFPCLKKQKQKHPGFETVDNLMPFTTHSRVKLAETVVEIGQSEKFTLNRFIGLSLLISLFFLFALFPFCLGPGWNGEGSY